MARFIDIFYFVVAVCFAIGLVNSLLVSAGVISTSQQFQQPNITNSIYSVSDARETINGTSATSYDSFTAGIGSLGMALGFLVTMLNVFTLYGTLLNIFHVPPIVATAISGLIGLVYMSFIIQFVTARYFKMFGD